MHEPVDVVRKYYESWGSRLGYDLILKKAQHCGYYSSNNKNIGIAQAQRNLREQLYQRLRPGIDEKILDAGCGQGVVMTELAALYGNEVYGITITPHEIESSKERAVQAKVQDKCHFSLQDYTKTRFESGFFDAIYTVESMSHSYDLDATLKEFYRILKPGGRIVLLEYTLASLDVFPSRDQDLLKAILSGSLIGLKSFRHDKLPDILASCGFSEVLEENISENILPFAEYLNRLSYIPYHLLRLFKFDLKHLNISGGYRCGAWLRQDLLRYCIFTARKS